MPKLLVITPSPKSNESMWGYVLRLSEKNGYESPLNVLSAAGLNAKNYSGRLDHAKLAAVVGRAPSTLIDLSYSGPECSQTKWYLMGQHCGNGFRSGLRLQKPAVCPQCVTQEGYIHAWFDFDAVIACPTHRCMLLHHCPSCSETLSWRRRGLLRCRCGTDLTNVQTTAASSELVDWTSILIQKLKGLPLSDLDNRSHFPISDLEGIPLKKLVTISRKLELLGIEAGLGKHNASNVLAHWPRNYWSYLDAVGQYCATKSKGNVVGLSAHFERLGTALFRTGRDRKYTGFLSLEFSRYGREKWMRHVDYSEGLSTKSTSATTLSLSAIAKRYNQSFHTVYTWAKRGLFPVERVQTKKGAVRYIVHVKDIEEANPGQKATFKKTSKITARKAARRLCIPENVLKVLEERNVFTKFHQTAYKERFTEQDVHQFEQRLLALANSRNDLRPCGLVALSTVLLRSKFGAPDHKADFVEHYLKGTIAAAGRWGESIQDIYFEEHFVRGYVEAALRAKHPTVSASYVAKTLRCQQRTIPGLVDDGHLEQVATEGGFAYITKKSLEDFSAKYVSCAGLAKDWKTAARHLVKIGEPAGISFLLVKVHGEESRSAFIQRPDLQVLKNTYESYRRPSER